MENNEENTNKIKHINNAHELRNVSIHENELEYLEDIRKSRNMSLFDTLKLSKEFRTQKDKPIIERENACPSIIDMARMSNRHALNIIEREDIPIDLISKYKDFKPGNIRK